MSLIERRRVGRVDVDGVQRRESDHRSSDGGGEYSIRVVSSTNSGNQRPVFQMVTLEYSYDGAHGPEHAGQAVRPVSYHPPHQRRKLASTHRV